MPEVSVVVAARDAEETLGATLDALAAMEGAPPHEVLVVDNGSRDGTATLATDHPLTPRVLRRRRGAGPGAARNDGARAARAPVIAFTDADCAPVPSWLAEGVAALERDGCDIVQGKVLPQPGRPVGPFDRTLGVVSEYGLYETANLFIRRETFERAGGFEDVVDAGRPFGEDAVLVWRARRQGARTTFSDAALVHHAVFAGGPADYLSERARDGLFALLAAHLPELREDFMYRRWFLSKRSAAFDLALLGGAVALARRSPIPLAFAMPWLVGLRSEVRTRAGRDDLAIAATVAYGDALAFRSLVRGSLRARTIVL